MAKRNREHAEVQLIPYYEYDPTIHNIDYRYFDSLADDYDYDDNNNDFRQTADYRQPYGFGGYGYGGGGRPRRRRRRRPFYPPYFAPFPPIFPVPIPVPFPRPPFWGGGYWR